MQTAITLKPKGKETMNILTLDVETTHVELPSGGTSPLPYFNNRLVSVGYKWLNDSIVTYDCFYHSVKEPDTGAVDRLREALQNTDMMVGQNLKFDLSWLRACGFTYDGQVYDTMVAEYILAKARRWPLGLEALANKYGGVQKEKDLIKPFFDDGKTFYDIPWDIIEEYGTADVLATEHVALKQLEAFGTTFEEIHNGTTTDTNIKAIA